MAGYVQEERKLSAVGCGLALLWLPPSLLFFVLMALGGFGCEGAPQPCTADWTRPLLLIAVTALLGFATTWAAATLRDEKRGLKRNAAATLAFLLVASFVALVWWICDAL